MTGAKGKRDVERENPDLPIQHIGPTIDPARLYDFHKRTLRRKILNHLPRQLQALLRKARQPIDFLRVQAPVSHVLGPQYRRSRTQIQIDLTWSCNLRCFNCNRSCEQAPTGERMDLDQIRHFVDESVAACQRWEQIHLLGGEPTLHPELSDILDMLLAWRNEHSPKTLIQLTTNGYGSKVQAVLEKLPSGIVLNNTYKESRCQPFDHFNIAPVDRLGYLYADYTNGCFVTHGAGIGLTPYGWYPCAVAGGIDRIIGLDIGRKHLPSPGDDMFDQMRIFCKLCGCFARMHNKADMDQTVKSAVWEQAYAQYRETPPTLTRY